MPSLYRTLTLALLTALLTVPAFAAEPNDAEALLDKLNELETTKSRSLAKRWEGLIRLRQWKSASGKHTTYAKYVGHASDMSSIKLLVLVPGGDERTEKLVDVPLEKLDKDAQTLLKRIAKAREAVEEVVGEADTKADETSSSRESEPVGTDGIAEERGQRGYEPATSGQKRLTKPLSIRSVTANSQQMPNLKTPVFPDDAAWRTSYDAFIKNLSAKKLDPEGPKNDMANWELDWGKLQNLRWQWEYLSLELEARSGRVTREQSLEARKKFDKAVQTVGEVAWTGTLKQDLPEKTSTGIEFDFPHPPEPFDVVFFIDKDFQDTAKPFKKGEQVKFIGRFKSFGISTPAIIVHVRFPDEQAATNDSKLEAEREDVADRGLPPGVAETLRKRYEANDSE